MLSVTDSVSGNNSLKQNASSTALTMADSDRGLKMIIKLMFNLPAVAHCFFAVFVTSAFFMRWTEPALSAF